MFNPVLPAAVPRTTPPPRRPVIPVVTRGRTGPAGSSRTEPCPRCGAPVRAVLMFDHALHSCPRHPARLAARPALVFLSTGRPSAQHDETAD